MLSDTEKRAAKLAVSQYGADRAKVDRAVEAVLEAQSNGERTDLLDVLKVDSLLTSGQVEELRQALDATQLDPKSGNGRKEDSDSGSAEIRVIGDYHILRRLGEGGMGSVYLGYREADGRYVAIKVLRNEQQESIDRFYREAKSGATLNHPNIVRNIAAGQDRNTNLHYLILEYVDGPSAQHLLDELGSLQLPDAVRIIIDVARALEYLHSRNTIHRDIKPGNILITRSGVAKLTDLGLAKRTDEASHLTGTRQGFGTPYYMPYEQAMNAKRADARSDIYALGATLYHLVTGDVPFPGKSHLEIIDKKKIGEFEPASELNTAVPPVLDHIICKMLARNPRDRYQTASELIVDLERSRLAANVPSFVDYDVAMKDPFMRQRLTAPPQPTCPDLREADSLSDDTPRGAEVWHLRIVDGSGKCTRLKATVAQIYKGIKRGRLNAKAEASQEPNGVFLPLARYPEFQRAFKTVAEAGKRATVKGTRATRRQVWAAYMLASAVLLATVGVAIWLLFLS
jgi:serine/threonine-protein kinase